MTLRGGRGILPATLAAMTLAIPVASSAAAQHTITLVKAASLQTRDTELIPSMSVSVGALGGGYAVSYRFTQPQIAHFSRTGALQRSYSRSGSGPAEFRSAPLLVSTGGDSMLAIEGNRVTVFDSMLRPSRTYLLAVPMRVTGTALPNGSIVIDARVRGVDQATYSVALLGSDGSRLAAMEPVSTSLPNVTSFTDTDSDGSWWLMRANSDTLASYEADGTLQYRERIRGSEFVPWSEEVPGEGLTAGPRPHHAGLRVLPGRRILLVTWCHDPKWKPASANLQSFGLKPAEEDLSAVWDTLLELIDVADFRVIARARYPAALSLVSGAAAVATTREDEDGNVTIDVFNVVLR